MIGGLVGIVFGAAFVTLLWINGTIVGENQLLERRAQADRAEYVVCVAKVARLEIKKGGK